MNQEITVFARAKAKSGREAHVGEILKLLVQPTRAESGCKFYRLFGAGESGIFYFYELWESTEALSQHAKSGHILAAQEALKDQLETPIEVSITSEIDALELCSR
jgi:quinol monooxygenase YgiN